MNLQQQIAKHFREIHFGGNWTSVNLKDILQDVTWQQATTPVHNCNTIAVLVYHINYYISEVLKVLQGAPLGASDKFSFNCPPITTPQQWEDLLHKTYDDAEKFASLIELLSEEQLWENFTAEKYGNYYRNLHGIIEHSHYHLGQIVLLKKILQEKEKI